MKLELRSIVGKGVLAQERLTLRANSELDVGDFALFQISFIDKIVSTDVLEAFWFPYQTIDKGDLVVVYTKAGSNRSKKLEGGHMAHFFYWGKDNCIWDDDERAAVVLLASEWTHKGAAELWPKRVS